MRSSARRGEGLKLHHADGRYLRGLRINPLLAEHSTLAEVIKSAIMEVENGPRVAKGKKVELCRLKGFLKGVQALVTGAMMEVWRDQRLEAISCAFDAWLTAERVMDFSIACGSIRPRRQPSRDDPGALRMSAPSLRSAFRTAAGG